MQTQKWFANHIVEIETLKHFPMETMSLEKHDVYECRETD